MAETNDSHFRSREFEFEVYGDYALFTDPVTKLGGEKFSYPFPTYEALKGIVKGIYWKPTIVWFIDEVRIMNEIRNVSVPVRNMMLRDSSSASLSFYSYLRNVHYHVRAHFEWNMNRRELESDRKESKHTEIFLHALECGGRRSVYLGTSECGAYVEPCAFDEGRSFYDGRGSVSYGMPMFHSFTYADEAYSSETQGKVTKAYWTPEMENGIIKFPRPSECNIQMPVSKQSQIKIFGTGNDVYTSSEKFYKGDEQ